MQKELSSVRETVESVWVAIVMAFVLRAFIIEAFVIPTGSMAPRLLGEHWDLQCPACGYEYSFGEIGAHGAQFRRQRFTPTAARCPNCSYPYPGSQQPGYVNGGDRVLVLKYLYHFRQPRPWDVIVFKNPQNNRENYIKRLIGLPGETVEIVHGDIFVKAPGRSDWRIRRKPDDAQNAMWQVIFDNDYQPDLSLFRKTSVAPPAWVAASGRDMLNMESHAGRKWVFHGTTSAQVAFQARREDFLPTYGYNVPQHERGSIDENIDMCTDLKLSCVFVPQSQDAKLALELTSFDNVFRAELSADGDAVLLHRTRNGGLWSVWSRAKLPTMQTGQGRSVSLEHADLSVALRVGDEVVLQSTEDQYRQDYYALKRALAAATKANPVPPPEVRITVMGGPQELLHVKLMRDVYYTNPALSGIVEGPLGDYARRLGVDPTRAGWGTTGHPIHLSQHPDNPDLDEFFALGDNSPQSLDGRGWSWAAPTLRLYDDQGNPIYKLGTVPRYNMIGKALFVYWPSGFRPPGLPGMPIIPNAGRMRLIR